MVWNEMDVSEDTKRILNELVKRKNKMENAKLLRNVCSALSIVIGGFVFYYTYEALFVHFHGEVTQVLNKVFEEKSLTLIFLLTTSILFMNTYSKQHTKHKNKYEALRTETIGHLQSHWLKNMNTYERDLISKEMKEKYDINLAYKS